MMRCRWFLDLLVCSAAVVFTVNAYACPDVFSRNGDSEIEKPKFRLAPTNGHGDSRLEQVAAPAAPHPQIQKVVQTDANFGLDPVADLMRQRREAKDPMNAAEMFRRLIVERNAEECRCKPHFLKRAAIAAVNGVNVFFRNMFGGSVRREALYRRRFGNELRKAGSDADVVAAVIARVRRQFYDTLKHSIEADVRFAKIYREQSQLLASARAANYYNSEILLLVSNTDALAHQIMRLKHRKWEIESDQRSEQNSGEYADLSVKLREQSRAFIHAKRELLTMLKQRNNNPSTEAVKKFEDEVLIRAALQEKYQHESQLALANLFVAMESARILETMLEGDLNGLDGPIDPLALSSLNDFFASERPYLGDPLVFGAFYSNRQNGLKALSNKKATSVEKLNELKLLARHWMDLWHGRLAAVEPRINFNFAVASVGLEFMRFIANNNLRAQKDNLKRAAGWLGSQVTTVAKQTSYGQQWFAERHLSLARQEEVDRVKDAFAIIALQAREPIAEADVHADSMRDEFSVIHTYLLNREAANETLDPEVRDLFASAQAMDVFNWMYARAVQNQTNGKPFNSVIANKILEVQLLSVARYEKLAPELAENISVWVAAYYTASPMFGWLWNLVSGG